MSSSEYDEEEEEGEQEEEAAAAAAAAAGGSPVATRGRAKHGRPPMSNVWDQVLKTPQEDGKTKQTCIHCGFSRVSGQLQATGMTFHLIESCTQCPMEIKKAIWQSSNSDKVKELGNRVFLGQDSSTRGVRAASRSRRKAAPPEPSHVPRNLGARPNKALWDHLTKTTLEDGRIHVQCKHW